MTGLDTHTHIAPHGPWRRLLPWPPLALCGVPIHGADPGTDECLTCLYLAARRWQWATDRLYAREPNT